MPLPCKHPRRTESLGSCLRHSLPALLGPHWVPQSQCPNFVPASSWDLAPGRPSGIKTPTPRHRDPEPPESLCLVPPKPPWEPEPRPRGALTFTHYRFQPRRRHLPPGAPPTLPGLSQGGGVATRITHVGPAPQPLTTPRAPGHAPSGSPAEEMGSRAGRAGGSVYAAQHRVAPTNGTVPCLPLYPQSLAAAEPAGLHNTDELKVTVELSMGAHACNPSLSGG